MLKLADKCNLRFRLVMLQSSRMYLLLEYIHLPAVVELAPHAPILQGMLKIPHEFKHPIV